MLISFICLEPQVESLSTFQEWNCLREKENKTTCLFQALLRSFSFIVGKVISLVEAKNGDDKEILRQLVFTNGFAIDEVQKIYSLIDLGF